MCPSLTRPLRRIRWQRQRERHQTIGFKSKTIAVHVRYNSWYTFFFFAVLCKTEYRRHTDPNGGYDQNEITE